MVERLWRKLLRVFRLVVFELQLPFKEWPSLLPLIQSALNNVPSLQRGNIAPTITFLGSDPTPPISTFIRFDNIAVDTLQEAHRESSLNVDALQARIA